MTDITYYVASTKGYLQQCDSLQHAMNELKKCEREQPSLGGFYILRTPKHGSAALQERRDD